MKLNDKDKEQIAIKGISLEEIEKQFDNFRKGFPYVNIKKPAIRLDGINVFSNSQTNYYASIFLNQSKGLEFIKFTPSSGAATRMFKELNEFVQLFESSSEKNAVPKSILKLINNLNSFAFYKKLKPFLEKCKIEWESTKNAEEVVAIIHLILDKIGLNYHHFPKALIEFHDYGYETRTPLEEQIIEGLHYCRQRNNEVKLHFTVSHEHREDFNKKIKTLKTKYENKYGVSLIFELSEQKESTDTIAVDENLNPFRDKDGQLVFRPGGHGTLIENLNEINADIIFIKNIDNVCIDTFKDETYLYKQALAGILLDVQKRVFRYLQLLDHGTVSEELNLEILDFARQELNKNIVLENQNKPINEILFQELNKPIRVCGMVENKGDAGGGPFWVEHKNGTISLQIIESAQIDLHDPVKSEIFSDSSHFNPVDLVCAVKDYKGNKFDLKKFIDHNTGFITKKSRNGHTVVAQEKPGLWNGSMAKWNTIFVEVPAITFNPVKSIDNLLEQAHLKHKNLILQKA